MAEKVCSREAPESWGEPTGWVWVAHHETGPSQNSTDLTAWSPLSDQWVGRTYVCVCWDSCRLEPVSSCLPLTATLLDGHRSAEEGWRKAHEISAVAPPSLRVPGSGLRADRGAVTVFMSRVDAGSLA